MNNSIYLKAKNEMIVKSNYWGEKSPVRIKNILRKWHLINTYKEHYLDMAFFKEWEFNYRYIMVGNTI